MRVFDDVFRGKSVLAIFQQRRKLSLQMLNYESIWNRQNKWDVGVLFGHQPDVENDRQLTSDFAGCHCFPQKINI